MTTVGAFETFLFEPYRIQLFICLCILSKDEGFEISEELWARRSSLWKVISVH